MKKDRRTFEVYGQERRYMVESGDILSFKLPSGADLCFVVADTFVGVLHDQTTKAAKKAGLELSIEPNADGWITLSEK